MGKMGLAGIERSRTRIPSSMMPSVWTTLWKATGRGACLLEIRGERKETRLGYKQARKQTATCQNPMPCMMFGIAMLLSSFRNGPNVLNFNKASSFLPVLAPLPLIYMDFPSPFPTKRNTKSLFRIIMWRFYRQMCVVKTRFQFQW